MNVFVYGTAGAAIATLAGYLVNQLPRVRKRPRAVRWTIITLLAILGVGSGTLAYWQFKTEGGADPIAAIQAPRGGEKISRILNVEIGVTRTPADDHSLWLGYQNEAGGPLIIQAKACVVFAKSADCGALHVGHDQDDPSSFKIFIFDSDQDATAHLKETGDKLSGGPGANMAFDEWPDGTAVVAMVRNISLRTART